MTIMDCPSENATLSKCNQRLDTVVVEPEVENPSVNGSNEKPIVSCLSKTNKNKTNNKDKKKNNVKFVEYITVTECLHFVDYSDDEFLGTWYTDHEMLDSQDEYRSVLEHATAGGSLAAHFALDENDDLCLRGLEVKTPMGCRRRDQNKRAAWEAVEREQYRQWDQGFKDPQALADEYQAATQHCVQKAILIAQEDRQAVLQQHKYFEMDGLSVGSKSLSSSHSRSSVSTSTTTTSSPLFSSNKKMPHHSALAGATGGRRPMPSHGRVSRAA